jgi:hypothetical protein
MSIFDLIHSAEKYAPIVRFFVTNRDKVIDEVATGKNALDAINRTDPAIIPHLESVTADLIKAAGAPPVAPGVVDLPHVVGKHIVAKALVAPKTLSPDERAWMDRASASGS